MIGLTAEQINQLSPNKLEEDLVKSYKKKNLKCGLMFLLFLAIEFSIILKLGIPITSPITIILTLVITIIWYIKQDTYTVEIHRIESGYYKKDFGFICSKCKTEVKIKFEDIEKYNNLPRDENGIRVMNCPNCNTPVPFCDFDIILKEYQNYKKAIK